MESLNSAHKLNAILEQNRGILGIDTFETLEINVTNIIDKILESNLDQQVYKYSYVDEGGNQLIDDDGNEVYLIPKHTYDIGEGAVAVPEDVFNGDITLRKLGKGQGTRLDL